MGTLGGLGLWGLGKLGISTDGEPEVSHPSSRETVNDRSKKEQGRRTVWLRVFLWTNDNSLSTSMATVARLLYVTAFTPSILKYKKIQENAPPDISFTSTHFANNTADVGQRLGGDLSEYQPKRANVTPRLRDLHWLAIAAQSKFKSVVLA